MRDADDQKANGSSGDGAHDREVVRPLSTSGNTRNVAEPAGMQRQHERSRMVVDGKRTDDGTRCSLVVIREVSGKWGLYPQRLGQIWCTSGAR